MIMQSNFRPSHARTRSAGYAVVNVDEFDDYMEAGQNHDGRDSLHAKRARSPARTP
jgi:hypothetical protein